MPEKGGRCSRSPVCFLASGTGRSWSRSASFRAGAAPWAAGAPRPFPADGCGAARGRSRCSRSGFLRVQRAVPRARRTRKIKIYGAFGGLLILEPYYYYYYISEASASFTASLPRSAGGHEHGMGSGSRNATGSASRTARPGAISAPAQPRAGAAGPAAAQPPPPALPRICSIRQLKNPGSERSVCVCE